MRLIRIILAVLLLSFCGEGLASQSGPDSYGREFVVGFNQNLNKKNSYDLELHVTSLSSNNVTVCVDAPLVTNVNKVCNWTTLGVVAVLYIPYSMRMNGSGIESKGLLITATEDIVAYGINKEKASTDGFLALPVDVLGTEYYSMHAFPQFKTPDYAQFAVIATDNNTLVDIVVSSLANASVSFQGNSYGPSSSLQVTLNRYQTLQLQSLGDMTGSKINASKPVAFFTGNQKTTVMFPNENGTSGDHLVEQLPPIPSWGQEFLTVPVVGRTGGDLVRILGTVDGTKILIVQTTTAASAVTNLTVNAGKFHELNFPSNATHYITSSSPIGVFQFSKTAKVDNADSDPFLLYVPAVDQFMSLYTFTTIQSIITTTGYIDSVNLFIDSSKVSGLRLNGLPLDPNNYTTIPAANGAIGIQLTVDHGTHQLSHVKNVTFGAFMYGQLELETYGYPAGMRVENLIAKKAMSTSTSTLATTSRITPTIANTTSGNNSSKQSSSGSLTVGIAVAAAVLVALAAALVIVGCCCCGAAAARRRRKKKEEEDEGDLHLQKEAEKKKKSLKQMHTVKVSHMYI